MRKVLHYSRITLVGVLTSALMACGGAEENQDGPLPSIQSPPQVDVSIPIAGVALSGFVANGLVWIDLRENNTIDGTEPVAYTDSQGYFSYNPNTGIDYCAASGSYLEQYCLKTGINSGSVTIKVAKGIEVLTGTPFNNVLTRVVDLETAATRFATLKSIGAKPSGDTQLWQQQIDNELIALSPLATLAHYLPADISVLEAITALGFNIDADISATNSLQMNFIEGVVLNTPMSTELFAANILIARVVDQLTLNFDSAFDSIDLGFDGYAISTADSIYKSLAGSITAVVNNQNSPQQATSLFHSGAIENEQNQVILSDLISNLSEIALNTIHNEISANTTSLPTNLLNRLQGIQNNASMYDVVEGMKAIISESTNAITTQSMSIIPENKNAVAEQLVMTAVSNSSYLASLNNIGAFVSQKPTPLTMDPVVQRLVNAILVAVRQSVAAGEAPDVTLGIAIDVAITNLTASNFPVNSVDLAAMFNAIPENILTIDEIPSALEFALATINNSESILSNKHLSLSGVQSGGEQGQVIVFLNGSEQERSGKLIMCVAYSNDDDSSDNISAQRFTGSWAAIGNSQNRISLVAEGFTVQMNIAGEARGSDIPANQQVEGLQRNPNEFYGKFGFTLNADSATWYSDDASIDTSYGLLSTLNTPETNADCASSLSFQVP